MNDLWCFSSSQSLRIDHFARWILFSLNLYAFAFVDDRFQNAQQTIQYFASPIDTRQFTAQIDGHRALWLRFESQFWYHIEKTGEYTVTVGGHQLRRVQQQAVQHEQWVFLNLFIDVRHCASQIRRDHIEKWHYQCGRLRCKHQIQWFIAFSSHIFLDVKCQLANAFDFFVQMIARLLRMICYQLFEIAKTFVSAGCIVMI